jgi:hypothetical protein
VFSDHIFQMKKYHLLIVHFAGRPLPWQRTALVEAEVEVEAKVELTASGA